jgi:nucleoside diphosphate kinase
LVGKIIARFEERGFKLIALKLVHATVEHLENRENSPLSLPSDLWSWPTC